MKKLHPKAEISYKISDTYENIANNVTKDDKPVALIYKAFDELGIKAKTYAMRGGTDGLSLHKCV